MNDLEDKFYRLLEQHHQLKKDYRSNQHHMKHLNARLARLIGEKKRKDVTSSREVDMEELLFDMHTRMTQLEKDNLRLKQANLLYRTQLSSRVRMYSSSYTHVTARVDSGINHHQRLNRLRSQSTLAINCSSFTDESESVKSHHKRLQLSKRSSGEAKITGKLLQEARDEIERLESIIAQQQQQLQGTSSGISFKLNTSNQTDREGESEMIDMKSEVVNEKIVNYVDSLRRQVKSLQEDTVELQKYQLMCKSLEYKLNEAKKRINELEGDKSLLEQSLHKCLDSCMSELKSNLTNSNNSGVDDHQSKHLLESYLCRLAQIQEHCQRVQREKDLLEKELMVEREVNSRLRGERQLLLHKTHQSGAYTDQINILYPGDDDARRDKQMVQQQQQQKEKHSPTKRQEIQVDVRRERQQQQQVHAEYGSHHLLLPSAVSEHELPDGSIGYSNSESLLDELQQMRSLLEQVLRENDIVNSSSPTSSM